MPVVERVEAAREDGLPVGYSGKPQGLKYDTQDDQNGHRLPRGKRQNEHRGSLIESMGAGVGQRLLESNFF